MAATFTQTPAVNASGSFTVLQYTNLAGSNVTVDGHTVTEGSDWTAAVSNATTASSLKDAIDATGALVDLTTALNGSTITLTSKTTGAAGNDVIGIDRSASDANLALVAPGNGSTLGGGTDAVTAGLIGSGRVRIFSIAAKSDSSIGSLQLFNGTDSTGAEYDLVTGVASKTTLRTYEQGVVLAHAYIQSNAHVTNVTVQFLAF